MTNQKIKFSVLQAPLFFFISLFFSVLGHTEVDMFCSNQPKAKWGEYYALSASTDEFLKSLRVTSFGVMEGSQEAQEMEPIDWVEECTVNGGCNTKLKSSQWKNAIPFEIQNTDLNSEYWTVSTVYINPSDIEARRTQFNVRLQVQSANEEIQDLRLTCNATYE
jgi:hypothetical protein